MHYHQPSRTSTFVQSIRQGMHFQTESLLPGHDPKQLWPSTYLCKHALNAKHTLPAALGAQQLLIITQPAYQSICPRPHK
jgi:hypothetical protein